MSCKAVFCESQNISYLSGPVLQRKNVAELLRMYLKHDMIDEAVELSTDYLYALTGASFDSFDLEVCLYDTVHLVLDHVLQVVPVIVTLVLSGYLELAVHNLHSVSTFFHKYIGMQGHCCMCNYQEKFNQVLLFVLSNVKFI